MGLFVSNKFPILLPPPPPAAHEDGTTKAYEPHLGKCTKIAVSRANGNIPYSGELRAAFRPPFAVEPLSTIINVGVVYVLVLSIIC